MYSEQVMDHFMNPRKVGEIPDASGVGEVGNAKCGYIMRIYLLSRIHILTLSSMLREQRRIQEELGRQ